MTNGGFLDQSKHANKTGLTLVIAGHAAVLAALALARPDAVRRIVYDPIVVGSYDEQKPPPLPEPAVQPRQPQTAPTAIDPIVRTSGDPILRVDPSPMPDADPIPRPLPVTPDPVFVAASIEPSALARFQPDYPPDLIRAEIEGSATVRVLIGADGRVKAVELVSAAQPGFFEATKRQALRYWRFRPATKDGIATENWQMMTVRFRIQG